MKKTRIDAWGADLPEKVQWDCYDLCRALPWPQGVLDQLGAIGVQRLPTRAGWYRFLGRMRQADAERRIEKIAQSVAEAQDVADRHGIRDKVFVETLKTLAIDRAMSGDNKAALSFAGAAAAVWDRAQKEKELELKAARQRTADEQLKLAREKFEAAERRLAAVQEAVKSAKTSGGGLTPETLRKIEEAAGLL